MKMMLGMFAVLAILGAAAPRISHPAPANVKITTPTMAHGSGFHIGGGIIVTAFHVVDTSPDVAIDMEDGTKTFGHVFKADPALDLALVQIDNYANLDKVRLGCREAVIGEAIEAVGNPADIPFYHTWGRLSARAELFGRKVLVGDMTLAPGMSGGATYDAWGFVIGVNDAILNVDGKWVPSISYIVPSTSVCQFTGRT